MLSIMSSMRGQLSHWEAASWREAGRLFNVNIMRGQLFHMALSHYACLSVVTSYLMGELPLAEPAQVRTQIMREAP